MRVLSFDIGTKNLCYADIQLKIDSGEVVLHGWSILDFMGASDDQADTPPPPPAKNNNIEKVSSALIRSLSDTFGDVPEPYDYVLVENQPAGMNPIMKTIQVIVYTFFQTARHLFGNVRQVVMVSATLKLSGVVLDGENEENDKNRRKPTYAERKKLSVRDCRAFLASTSHETGTLHLTDDAEIRNSALAYFDKHRKKDDLADALLQGLAYYRLRVLRSTKKQ